jgi:hypothetical protein
VNKRKREQAAKWKRRPYYSNTEWQIVRMSRKRVRRGDAYRLTFWVDFSKWYEGLERAVTSMVQAFERFLPALARTLEEFNEFFACHDEVPGVEDGDSGCVLPDEQNDGVHCL